MRMIRSFIKSVFIICLIISTSVFSLLAYLENTVSKDYKIVRGDVLNIDSPIPITAEYNGVAVSKSLVKQRVGESFEVDLKLFGTIPFSTVNVEVVDEMQVAVLGTPFGMKLYTEGVLVIDMTDVETDEGNINPAAEADIRRGDYICTVNGLEISCNEDLLEIVSESGGNSMDFVISRNGEKMNKSVKAVYSTESGGYRIGIWVRDSSAGIGTLTFYSPAGNMVCGLGHGICDEDTNELLTVHAGEMVNANILSVKKGEAGAPGELKGALLNSTIADISLNSDKGVYGILHSKLDIKELTQVALKQEVENGDAQIFCTVDGEKPTLYSCAVKKRSSSFHSPTQNFIVTITDPVLIEKTGGIVQGMSGSPILQNGKLIGAVTHVLVDDPTKGYGIFAENMLETAQSVGQGLAPADKLKEAS